MKKISIRSFDDPNFFKLGLFCCAIGILCFIFSFIFDFAGIIALRGGGGIGMAICLTYYIARYFKRKH